MTEACQYAEMFITVSDSLNLGERQRQAATVNNRYKYYRDQEEERKIKEESEHRRRMNMILSFSFVLIIVSITAIYNYIRRRQLKIILSKTEELTSLKQDTARKDAELGRARRQLADINSQLERASEDLKTKEAQLIEKTRQGQMLARILHQSEMENTAGDVIDAIRRSAVGKYHMSQHDWKRLYHAVDSLYPTFKDTMLEKLGKLSEPQFQVCYLLCIGLTNPEIQNLTDISASTVWRWAKKFNSVLNLPLLR